MGIHIKSIDSMELICTVEDSAGHKQKYSVTISGEDNLFISEVTHHLMLNVSSAVIRMLDTYEINNTKEEKFGRED